MHIKTTFGGCALALALTMLPAGFSAHAQDAAASQGEPAAAAAVPVDQAVTMTCRQAWQAGGRTKEGFFAIVEELADLSSKNRDVTLPDDKAAGQRAGEWIRTQALKDPDQLLYAVVDHAVRYSIRKGTSTPVAGAPNTPPSQ
jgi:predicted acyl esterase